MNFLKDYEPVEDRLRAFWSEHPEGRVETVLVEHADSTYVMKALVWRDQIERLPAATGFATENVTDRGVNATSALENCETSAIGRALANLGYAAKGKRPSREEMSKASGTPLAGEKASGKGGVPDQRPSDLAPEGTSAATTVPRAGVLPADDAAPGEDMDASPPSSPGSGPRKYRRNPDTLQLEEVE